MQDTKSEAVLVQGVSKQMQPINMIMTYYWNKRNGGHLEHFL